MGYVKLPSWYEEEFADDPGRIERARWLMGRKPPNIPAPAASQLAEVLQAPRAKVVNVQAARNAAKTHCPQNHEYSPENTYVAPDGSRQYKTCRKVRVTESYYRHHQKRLAEKAAWRSANVDLHRQRAREWLQNNRERANLTSRLKKQRRRAAGILTTEDWALVLEIYGSACLKCGKDEVTIDHIVPVIKGGANLIGNVQPLCGSCNSAKRDTSVDYRPFPIEHVIGGDIPDPRQAPEAALTLF